MLGPLPHSFSDSTGQRALRLGSGPPMPSPQQDIAPGMLCRRVSAEGGGKGGSRQGGAARRHLARLAVPKRGRVLLCGADWQLAWGGGCPCMASPLYDICSMLWHLRWHVGSIPCMAAVSTHGNAAVCSFLLGKLRHRGQVCGSMSQPGLAQLGVGRGTQHRMVAFQGAICTWECHWGDVRLHVGALGRWSREHIGTCGGCSCLGV